MHASTTEMHAWACDYYRQCGDILLPTSCTHRLSGGPGVHFGGSSSLARVEDWQPCCCCVRLSDRLVAHSPCLRVSSLFMCASWKIFSCLECRRVVIIVCSKATLTRWKRIYLSHYLHDSIEAATVVVFCNSATWSSGRGDIFFFPIVFFLESLLILKFKESCCDWNFPIFIFIYKILEPHWSEWYQNWDSPVLWECKTWMVIKKDWWVFSVDCSISCKEIHIGGPRSRELVRPHSCQSILWKIFGAAVMF